MLIKAVTNYLLDIARAIHEGIRMIDEMASPLAKLLADTHHMNIEEKSIAESIRQARSYLAHLRFSDSKRITPGHGDIDSKVARWLEYLRPGGSNETK